LTITSPLIVVALTLGMVVGVLGVAPRSVEDAIRIRFGDLSPTIQSQLAREGMDEGSFGQYVAAVEADTSQRVADGDREHLIYFGLQSGRFTRRSRIEPALSARRFVDRLSPDERKRLLADAAFLPRAGLPPEERARLADLLTTLGEEPDDLRLQYFSGVVRSLGHRALPEDFYSDYVRVARFLYQKEFVAPRDAAEVARLYQTRPLSSDTQIDAGFGVWIGLGVIRALDPAFRVRRVLVVGPGLDLAPRTELIDAADLQSYQPLAVADGVLSLGLAVNVDLRVHSVDVNPRVVLAVQGLARDSVRWHVFSGLTETPGRTLSAEYRDYVKRLGRAIGGEVKAPSGVASDRHYHHTIAVRAPVSRMLSAESLNVITQRLTNAPFDVIIATNVLSYFDRRQLTLALANLAAMLGPGGYLLHNETRDGLTELSGAAGLPVVQTRTAILGGPPARPFYDSVWIHRKG
jgi:hypothetical protein